LEQKKIALGPLFKHPIPFPLLTHEGIGFLEFSRPVIHRHDFDLFEVERGALFARERFQKVGRGWNSDFLLES
jgi:hypothetical protein